MRIGVIYSFSPQQGIVSGLKSLGCHVELFYYGLEKHSFVEKKLTRIFNLSSHLLKLNFNRQLEKLLVRNEKRRYDLILIVKGNQISKGNSKKLKLASGVKKVLWTTDSVVRYPAQLSVQEYMDKIFLQDGKDCDSIDGGSWLPLGFDPNLFEGSSKDIDLLLFGNCSLPFYKTRVDYILEASHIAKSGNQVTFVGSGLDKATISQLENNGVKVLQKAKYSDFCDLVARSKICLNIHQDDGNMAINPLFFAIPYAKSIQITDQREYYEKWLTPNKDYFPIQLKDLNRILKYLIKEYDQIVLSKEDREKIQTNHSYSGRARRIIES